MPVTQKFLPIEEVNAIIAGLRTRPEFAGIESATAAEYRDWTDEESLRVRVIAKDAAVADWAHAEPVEEAVADAVAERGDSRFVYFTWSTVEEERRITEEGEEDYFADAE